MSHLNKQIAYCTNCYQPILMNADETDCVILCSSCERDTEVIALFDDCIREFDDDGNLIEPY